MAVLKAYFDESGTDRNSPWITLAGWVTERDRWRHLSTGWRRVLKGPPEVPEAKGADMEARRGAFEGWTDRQVQDFRWNLSRRIDAQVRFGVSISVQRGDYERVIVPTLPPYEEHPFGAFRDPYVWLMTSAIGMVMESEHLKPNERVHFIFDEGHEGQGKAEDFFYWMHDMETDRGRAARIVKRFTKVSSFEFPPAQAADLLAWGCNHGIRKDRPVNRPFIEIRSILGIRTPVRGGDYDADGLNTSLFSTGYGGEAGLRRWERRGRRRGLEDAWP